MVHARFRAAERSTGRVGSPPGNETDDEEIPVPFTRDRSRRTRDGDRHAAGAQSLSELSLEDLMRLDAGRVFGASERSQPVTEAPASVSFITAEDIARYGYRSLADILHGVRGLYVSDDRNFSFLGARGFGKPGDYNSRILLLVNGHRVNDNVFGQAEIGAEFGLDPATFERVEIIRGPASSLYGDSAFFAVVNVITRTGATIDGAPSPTRPARMARSSPAAWLDAACRTASTTPVPARLSAATASTVVFPGLRHARDELRQSQKASTASTSAQHYGRLRCRQPRRSPAPTAADARTCRRRRYGTLFNEQIDRERTIDRHTVFDVDYTRPVGASRVALRGAYDRFTSTGYLPVRGWSLTDSAWPSGSATWSARGGLSAAA